jgi:micrococcal nuclease
MRSGWWTGLLLLAAIVALLVLGGLNREEGGDGDGFAGGGDAGSDPVSAEVLGVTDGDTIDVLLDGEIEHVRYIGINTPESNPDQPLECFGKQAEEANRELVEGETVSLEFGPELRDRYDRLLAYVSVGGLFVNAELVERGFARSLTISPNDARAPLFERLETEAGRAGLGLWGACNG